MLRSLLKKYIEKHGEDEEFKIQRWQIKTIEEFIEFVDSERRLTTDEAESQALKTLRALLSNHFTMNDGEIHEVLYTVIGLLANA